MNAIYYIGLDIHKKTIAYCIKTDITFLQYDLPVGSRRSGDYVNRKLLHNIYYVSRPTGWPQLNLPQWVTC